MALKYLFITNVWSGFVYIPVYFPTDAYTEYAFTFYWVYEIFVDLGCNLIGMWTKVDMWVVMLLQITGFLYFASMFGYVASTRSASASALLEQDEKTKDLANFLYQENVDPMLTATTLKYFEYVWKRTNGSNPQKIYRRLNSALMDDTLVFRYKRALREVPMFGKVERSFIRVITQHLHEMYFLKGDTVIQCRDVQSFIFIIYCIPRPIGNQVDVLTSYNEMITCMGPGGMLGNFTGQPVLCSEVTICASRSLDLLVIPSTMFFNLIKYYPKIQDPLNKAFETSRDYLPITMEINDDTSSDYQLKKFWKYTKELWVTERGRQLPVLLSQTPYVRRCDLMSAMFGYHLWNCYIFAETGEPFLRQLTVALDYTIFFPGKYIIVAGDSEARMYWVASGTVSVVSVRFDFTEITQETLGPGDVIGILQGMHRGNAYSFSYRAETKATILTLSLDSWINILPFFPDAKKIMSERSKILFTQI